MAELGVQMVGPKTRRVDDPTPAHVAASGLQRGVPVIGHRPGYPRTTHQSRAARHGIGRQGEVRGPGTDDRLAGHRQPAQHTGTQIGDPPIHLVGTDDLAAVVEVSFGLVLQTGKSVELFVGPRDQQCAGVLDRDTRLFGVVAEQLVAARHQSRLERFGGRVVSGVQQRGIGLAGAVTDVVACLEQGHREFRARECARNRGADDPGADDDDVADIDGATHVVVGSSCARTDSAARIHRDMNSSARSADHSGW